MKKGFTLLELLVVVLIIGILAGIALPQYQMSVEKAKAAEALTNMRAIIGAVERSILIHGNENFDITHDHENWDIELSGGYWDEDYNYITNDYIYLTYDDPTGIYVLRCAGKCQDKNTPYIFGLWGCYPSVDSDCPIFCDVSNAYSADKVKGKRICKALEGLGVENRS